MARPPPCVICARSCGCQFSWSYKYSMLILTFFCYMSYHISRKPLSIVKGELHRNCSKLNPMDYNHWWGSHSASLSLSFAPTPEDIKQTNTTNGTWCDFAPFDRNNYKSLYGDLDYAFLITYAFGMYFSGMIAERVSLRYFLSIGMVLCGLFTAMFGLGYFYSIHSFAFYVVAQVLNGLAQTTGWPGVVTCVGNWFGKSRRGFIMGVWNSHTSFGNILGSVIASAYVGWAWGYSFVVPGIIIGALGILTFLVLIDGPEDVGIDSCDHCEAQYHPIPNLEESEAEASSSSSDVATKSHQQYHSITSEDSNLNVSLDNLNNVSKSEAIGFMGALKIPGVIEFSLSLLFAKLVSYTFLFWLPYYILNTSTLSTQNSGLLSTLFDVGGIFGGIAAGLVSDKLGGRAITCGVMLLIGACMMFLYNTYGSVSMAVNITLLLVTGAFVNGPYALITTAVSADLGTHRVLQGNSRALSTVTAIIDGTGSIGAAIGPFLTGLISPYGWSKVFYMLIASNLLAFTLLGRLILKELTEIFGVKSAPLLSSNIEDAEMPPCYEEQPSYNITNQKILAT